ncbi:MAG TPA: polysaccharide deacetylase family protein [Lachnospiraceae bacterium]|nr:polysaccharide deacetylase family protein [Lachnospiraceae bacterium]HPF29437.1 polysaccharide deacetylase family protein [Lachnospiraceae bacterium]
MAEDQNRNRYEGVIKALIFGVGVIAIVISAMVLMNEDDELMTSASNKRELPIYCVSTNQPMIALTFDAAWGNEDTGKILEILEKQGIKATFFMTGGWVSDYPDDVKTIYEAGHELGNHSMHHYDMATLGTQEIKDELNEPGALVLELTGYEMKVFRPPYGSYNNQLITTANECGYQTIQWDVDRLDWKDYGVDSIVSTVCNHAHLGNGSIILCHNGAEYTAQALDTMITNLKEQGYQFVTVSELIYTENYYMDHEGRQHEK